MRKYLLLGIAIMASFSVFSQDFSNKGKDFWVAYGYHSVMTQTPNPNTQQMVLYFATDQVTNITISIPGIGYSQNLTTLGGNNVITSATIPKGGPTGDARLFVEGLSNLGIHITSDKPMVAYAHIYNASVSGATILYPTNTLGRDYYSVNYKNWSNSVNSNCWFYVVATDTGTTTLNITPSGPTMGGWVAGTTYTVTLTQGQVYNVMAPMIVNNCPGNAPCTSYDLTGSIIKSINTGTGCKKIAVFSGSGRISITCNLNNSSSDNYMVQAMPKTAWGKKYLTTPAFGNQAFNFYRICVSNPITAVKVNGAAIAVPLQNNFYYELPITSQPQRIEADSAIMVAQYFASQSACGNGTPGDPEVIYLSSVEQNISTVIWNATPFNSITGQYFNAVIPNGGTGVSSFTLDGAALPLGSFVVDPQDANYSYVRYHLTGANANGFHIIKSDSGFNAIAYGFGGTESYGYNAGTNIKDLYQQIGVHTQYGIETTPSVCTNSPFQFKVSLPYIPDSMYWDFHNAAGMSPNNTNVFVDNTGNIAMDSTTFVNGKPIYWYSVPLNYSFSTIGTYPITIRTWVPNGECGSVQDIDFDLVVSAPPVADFSYTTPGCPADTVHFAETTPQLPKPTYHFWWDFGDPASGANNTSSLRNPYHVYSTSGLKTVRFSDITTPGCLSDTITHIFNVPPLPSATISGTASTCINVGPVPITFTGTDGIAPYIFNYTINAVPQPPVISNAAGTYTFNAAVNVSGTFVYALTSVQNQLPAGNPCSQTVTGQQITVTVNPDAAINLTSAAGTNNQSVCINTPITNITYSITGGGTGGTVTGLPAGVTGNYAAGTFTISGTPTVAGTFNYTVNTTGTCMQTSASGMITVNPDAAIVLTSAVGSDNQSLCENIAITPITYAISGGGTGAGVVGLPAGVTGTYAGGTFTISGVPTAIGTFNYTVTTTGTCGQRTATGTIIVNPDATITLTSAPATTNQSVCINVAITNITYTVAGGGTGANVTGLPTGVNGVYAGGTVTISGTPTVAGTFNYTVTTTGTCLQKTATGMIIVNPDAAIVLTSGPGSDNQTLCENLAITPITYSITGGGTGAGVIGLPAGVTGTYGGGIFTISGTPTALGTFNYTVTTTGTCVQKIATGTIKINPDATLTLTSAPATTNQSVCESIAITNITYNVGGGGTGANVTGLPAGITGVYAGGVVTISGSSNVIGTFNYTVTTTGTCAQKMAFGTITINPDATLTLSSAPATTNQELCNSTALTNITYSVGGGGTGATVVGLPAGVTGVYAAGTFTISGTPTANGVFNYIVTTTGTCVQKQANGTITVDALPTVNFNFSAPDCQSKNITFTDASTANTGTLASWVWDFGDATPPGNGTPISHTYATTGIFNVTLTVTTSKGCVNNLVRQVNVTVNPQAGFKIPAICLNDVAAVFQDTSKISAPGTFNFAQFWWDFGDPASGASNQQYAVNGTHTFTNVGNFLVTHVAVSTAGCTDTIKQNVFVNGSNPVANFAINNAATLCANDSVAITNQSTVAPGSITRIEIYWDNVNFPGGPPDIDNSPAPGKIYKHLYPNFQAPLTKNFNIRWLAYSGIICVNEITKTITVHAAPKVQFNPLPDACYLAAPYQITQASETGGVPGSGTFSGPGVSPTGIFSPAVAGIGTHTIKYTYTASGGGCVDTASQNIVVLDTAFADFTYNSPVCEHVDVTFTEQSTAPSGVVLANTVWDFGDGSPLENHAPGSVFTHIFPASSTYNVSMYNQSAYGCKSTVRSKPVTISPLPRPNFSFDKSSYCLPDASVTFDGSLSSIADGTENQFTYLWDFGDPASGLNNTSVAKTPSHVYSTVGPFSVNLTVTSGIGCVHDTTIQLTIVHPQPKADYTTDRPSVCILSSVLFTDITDPTSGATTIAWHWDMGDGSLQNTRSFPYTFTSLDTFNVSLYITNSFGCNSDTITKPFPVYDYPVIGPMQSVFVLEGGSVTLNPTVTGNDLQYLWTPNLYLDDRTKLNPVVTDPKTDITYTLQATGRGGCPRTQTIFVKLLKFPKIPNTFTPNGDGINDKWIINYLNTYPDNWVQVFSRSGQLVYESHGYKPGTEWDGTIKGKKLPVDTYYYIIEPGNGREPITGYVTILK